jgi:hypothetical protein
MPAADGKKGIGSAILVQMVEVCLREIHSRLTIVSMDIEQLMYKAGQLHGAASLLNRLSQR